VITLAIIAALDRTKMKQYNRNTITTHNEVWLVSLSTNKENK